MFEVNEAYKNTLNKGSLPENAEISGKISLKNGDEIELSAENLIFSSLNINNKSCSGSSLEIGSAFIGECKFQLITDLYSYDLYDAEVTIFYDALGNHIPLGVYYISQATRKSKVLSITAYDGMQKFDENIGNFTSNGRAFAMLSWLCNQTGTELGNTEEEINDLANSDIVLNISSGLYTTYRDALKDVASTLGGFATMNREGKLEIRQYKSQANGTLTARQRKNQTISEYTTYISEIDLNVDNIVYKSTTSQNDGLSYSLTNKMIKGLVSTVQPSVDNILDAVKDVVYTPAKYNVVYNPIFDLGDMIQVLADGYVLQSDIKTVITSFSFTFHSSSEITGVGESIFLAKRNKKSDASSAANSASAYAKNNGTYIETYSNIESYTVGTTQKNIVSIDYANGSADVIVLHGQACINCTTSGTIQLIYGVDGVSESFSPKHLIHEGYNTVEFYCYFLEPEENWLSTYTVDIVSEDAVGTIAIGDIRADVMATMTGNGRFIVDNVFDEQIPYYNRDNTLNNYLIGTDDPYAEEEDNG